MLRFLAPEALPLLLAIPVVAIAYAALLRRRRKVALRFAALELVKEAQGSSSWRRHVPPALFLLALAAALVAVARPAATVTLLSDKRTIVMAIDVSLSMRARDIEPTRMAAAQSAAKAFVQKQPDDTRIGLVTFAGTAQLVQPPTRDRDELVAAIDRFAMQRHTAIGSGLLLALATLFPDDDIDVEKAVLGGQSTRERARSLEPDAAKAPRKAAPRQAVPPGSHGSGAIILLTDGRRTTGPDPLEVAQMAARYGVRVFAVGFGKTGGGAAEIDGYSMYMAFDEPLLKSIAGITEGAYFHAPSAEELAKIYDEIATRFELERQHTEVTALFALLAGLVLALAGALSVLWFRRVA